MAAVLLLVTGKKEFSITCLSTRGQISTKWRTTPFINPTLTKVQLLEKHEISAQWLESNHSLKKDCIQVLGNTLNPVSSKTLKLKVFLLGWRAYRSLWTVILILDLAVISKIWEVKKTTWSQIRNLKTFPGLSSTQFLKLCPKFRRKTLRLSILTPATRWTKKVSISIPNSLMRRTASSAILRKDLLTNS